MSPYRLQGKESDMYSVATFRAVFEAKLPGYDALLSKTKYIAGDVRPCVLRVRIGLIYLTMRRCNTRKSRLLICSIFPTVLS